MVHTLLKFHMQPLWVFLPPTEASKYERAYVLLRILFLGKYNPVHGVRINKAIHDCYDKQWKNEYSLQLED